MPRPHHFSSPRAFAAAVRFEAVMRGRRTLMERGLARAGRSGGPVVVGPWLSEIGFELLYWIPALRRLLRRHGVAPGQVTVVSRGGVAPWYADIAEHYTDLFDLIDVETFRAGQRERVRRDSGEKQFVVTALDRIVRERLGVSGAVWVHPLAMYSRLRYFWAGETGLDDLDAQCAFERIAAPASPAGLDLPARYVAAKPYFSSCFPATDANRRFVAELLRRLADEIDVVLLTTGLGLDDHAEAEFVEHPRVHGLELRPEDNLATQTAVIAHAHALVATYGGPSYLGTLLGVPTVALESVANHNPRHLLAVRHIAGRLGTPPPELIGTDVERALAAALEAEPGGERAGLRE